MVSDNAEPYQSEVNDLHV